MNSRPHIQEAMDHLGAALIQTASSDDPIIMGHVRSAHALLRDETRSRRRQAERDAASLIDDSAGQALRDLESAIDNLREVDPKRFYGDSVRISAAAIQLDGLSKNLTRLAQSVIALQGRPTLDAAE